MSSWTLPLYTLFIQVSTVHVDTKNICFGVPHMKAAEKTHTNALITQKIQFLNRCKTLQLLIKKQLCSEHLKFIFIFSFSVLLLIYLF